MGTCNSCFQKCHWKHRNKMAAIKIKIIWIFKMATSTIKNQMAAKKLLVFLNSKTLKVHPVDKKKYATELKNFFFPGNNYSVLKIQLIKFKFA